MQKFTTYLIAALLCLGLSLPAYASGDYQVEVIIFKQLNSTGGNYIGNPINSNLELVEEIPSFADTWPLNNSLLLEQTEKMLDSQKYEILEHISWGQASADFKDSAATEFISHGLNGYIKVFATDLLFAKLKLSLEGNTISKRRRLKLDEVHYFDHAAFGVLLQVSRWEDPEKQLEEQAAIQNTQQNTQQIQKN